MAKQAVAKVGDSLPTERPSWMGDTSRGNEGVTADDMTIPRLAIIQDLSPQHKKGKPEYIEGAETKMIFNTATRELYGSEVNVVPVLFRKEWVIWKEIAEGGGFRGAYPTESEAVAALNELEDKDQCEVVDTAQHFVLVQTDKGYQQAVVSMSKSQMKPSRQWNSMIQAVGGDRFERMYTLSVVDAKNKAGQEYYNWAVKQLGYVDEATFKEAETLYEAVKSGAADIKREDEVTESHTQGDTTIEDDF